MSDNGIDHSELVDRMYNAILSCKPLTVLNIFELCKLVGVDHRKGGFIDTAKTQLGKAFSNRHVARFSARKTAHYFRMTSDMLITTKKQKWTTREKPDDEA